MRNHIQHGILAAALLLSSHRVAGGSIELDRIAVVAGNNVIKASDIARDLRLTAFLNGEPPESGADARRNSAERLIDQAIIRNDLRNGGYGGPTDAQVESLVNQIKRDRFQGSDVRLRDALMKAGISEVELRERLRWQLMVLRFIDQRFRSGVFVPDEEVRRYYDEHAEELRRQSSGNSSFTALEPKIRASLEAERADQNFNDWLKQARQRNRIEYKQEAFQ